LALTFQRAVLVPGLRLAEPLACLVAEHERRAGEHHSVTVSGCAVRPGDRLLDAPCPASVQNLAVPSITATPVSLATTSALPSRQARSTPVN
jgi:hypothetical protein